MPIVVAALKRFFYSSEKVDAKLAYAVELDLLMPFPYIQSNYELYHQYANCVGIYSWLNYAH
jgi:hypothetical protein